MSWVHLGLGLIDENEKEAHSDQCEDNADRAKKTPSWGNARGFLRAIQGLDARIQGRGSALPPLRLFGLDFHDRDSRRPRENGAAWG